MKKGIYILIIVGLVTYTNVPELLLGSESKVVETVRELGEPIKELVSKIKFNY